MLEPFTALSLAASVVQFVDFGSKLLIEGYGVYQSADGASRKHREIEHLTSDLKVLSGRLAATYSSGTATLSADEVALQELGGQSRDLAQELLDLLEDLKVKTTGVLRSWDTVKQTFRKVGKADKIEKMQKRLDRIRSQVNTLLLRIISNNASSFMLSLDSLVESSKKMHIENTDRLSRTRLELLSAIQRQETEMKTLAGTSRRRQERYVLALRSLEKSMSQLSARLTFMADEGAKTATSLKILESLTLREMRMRHTEIHDAYNDTFSWIFDDRQTHFKTWLQDGGGIFWISGKAGSGKSTLMKFLSDHAQTGEILKVWAAAKATRLVNASFYFWSSGNPMQKTQEGLLQSLLYQIFRQCPQVVPAVCHRRWSEDEHFHRNPDPWTRQELSDAIDSIVTLGGMQLSASFCFFIDGLDEYAGDQYNLLQDFDRLAQSENVKLCVSSRPCTVFTDHYGPHQQGQLNRQFLLQDLTKNDMEKFVRGVLHEDQRFKKLAERDTRAFSFVTEIRERAQGVFLWVFLVVRSLLRGLTNKDDIATLERRLNALPSDLSEYFKHIIDSIEDIYQDLMARTFQLAVYGAPLPLVAFWYLPKDTQSPEMALTAPIEEITDGEAQTIVSWSTASINAWCKDLLEVNKATREPRDDPLLGYKVDFLHRTVRDFLMTNDMQELLSKRMASGFEPWATLMRLHLALAKRLQVKTGSDDDMSTFVGVAKDLMYYANQHETQYRTVPTAILHELDRVGTHYRRHGTV